MPFSENFPSNFITKRWPLCCNVFNNVPLPIQEGNVSSSGLRRLHVKARPAKLVLRGSEGAQHSPAGSTAQGHRVCVLAKIQISQQSRISVNI